MIAEGAPTCMRMTRTTLGSSSVARDFRGLGRDADSCC